MNKKRYVFLPIEVGGRDFEARLLLSLYLSSYGVGSILIDDKVLTKIINFLPACGLFDKSFTNIIFNGRLKPASDNGWLVSGIDEEGYLTKLDTRSLNRFTDSSSKIVDAAFFWSKEHLEQTCIHTKNEKWREIGYVTGNQRIDLLCQNAKNYYKKFYGDFTNLIGNYTLVNTNFSANSSKTVDERLTICINNGEISSDEDKKNFINDLAYDKNVMDLFFEELQKLAAVTQKTILIRPHPAENMMLYYNKFSSNSKFMVQRSGPVEPWIHFSDSVIAHHCTTLIQAAVAGKPAFNFQPAPGTGLRQPDYFRGRPSSQLPIFDENIHLNQRLSNKFIKSLNRTWYLPKDNTLICEKIASQLAQLIYNKESVKDLSFEYVSQLLSRVSTSNYQNPKIESCFWDNHLLRINLMINSFSNLTPPNRIVKYSNFAILIS